MKRKTHIFLSLIVLSLVSCHILKKEKQTLKRLSQQEELQLSEQRQSLYQQSRLMLSDSNENDFTMMLWPKGKFTLSVANGFEGEAEKVMVSGKNTRFKVFEKTNETKKDSAVRTIVYKHQHERTSATEKTKNKVAYSWSWLLLLPVIYLFYRCYKILKLP